MYGVKVADVRVKLDLSMTSERVAFAPEPFYHVQDDRLCVTMATPLGTRAEWLRPDGPPEKDRDPAGNPKPNKAKSTGRIDVVVAAIMATGRAVVGNSLRAKIRLPAGYEVALA